MNFSKSAAARMPAIALVLIAIAGLARAADESATNSDSGGSQSDEIARLKAQLGAQQRQLEALERMLERQQQALDKALGGASQRAGGGDSRAPQATAQPGTAGRALRPDPGHIASLMPAAGAAPSALPAAPAPRPQNPEGGTPNPCDANPENDNAVPPYLRLGSVCAIPVGFMDLTGVWRNVNAGSGIGTNFASVPFNNSAAGHNSEYRFSPQNSRLGIRIDGNWKGAHFIGYNEFDFLGTSGGNNLGVTNGAFVPRLRLFWVDVRKNRWELLAGQSWSMLTPNRRGISPLPGDIFYSQVMDVNYLIGLTWTRQPGVRVLYHPSEKVTVGIALENPDQQIGGSSGAPVVTLPSALTSLAGSQLDNSSNVLATPNYSPDVILKVAFDPSPRAHIEFAGIERTFKIWNPAANRHSATTGGGVTWGINVEAVKNVRVITNGFWSDGGGRYLFGAIPDVMVRPDGSLSPIHAGGTTDGIEATIRNTLLFAYYGGAYAGRNVAIDADGKSLIGYGYRGSANSNNRLMEEITGGFNQTFWKNPRYGAINLIGQYEYFLRDPWYVAAGAPKSAHDNAIYVDIRYTLPGSIPNF